MPASQSTLPSSRTTPSVMESLVDDDDREEGPTGRAGRGGRTGSLGVVGSDDEAEATCAPDEEEARVNGSGA